MLQKVFTIIALSALIAVSARAHEGHEVPGQIKAQHGGVVKKGQQFHMELLSAENKAQLFPFAHAGEEITFNNIQITGTAKTPKGKAQTLKFEKDSNSFSTTVNFEGSHRVNLEIQTTYQGKKDSFKFLMEK